MRIGCCGFPVSQKRYFLEFDLVEIQSTSYRMPERKTVERWRRLPGEFILKCFQGITHSPQSPTWKKSGLEKNKDYGFLQPTEKNFKLWERMEEFSRILRSSLIMVQMPPSFSCNPANVKNLEEFFSSIDFQVALELRGDWNENSEVVRRICDSLNLIHVTAQPEPSRKAWWTSDVLLAPHSRGVPFQPGTASFRSIPGVHRTLPRSTYVTSWR